MIIQVVILKWPHCGKVAVAKCDQNFASKRYLATHTISVHSENRKSTCFTFIGILLSKFWSERTDFNSFRYWSSRLLSWGKKNEKMRSQLERHQNSRIMLMFNKFFTASTKQWLRDHVIIEHKNSAKYDYEYI